MDEARLSSSELAAKLVRDVWDNHGVDPLLLLCLVIPQEDLVSNTKFGGKLLEIVRDVVGIHNMPRLGNIVDAIQAIFVGKGATEWDPTALCTQACVRGWGKNKTVTDLRANVEKMSPVFAPCITQWVSSSGKRSFVVYQHYQDAICSIFSLLSRADRDCLQVVEVPAARDGVMKIYVDLEMYLSRMQCIVASSREERVRKLRALGEMLPELLSTILVDTGIISKTECVTFVIKVCDTTRPISCSKRA